MNRSFSSEVSPDSQKHAVVKPLLKAGIDWYELSSHKPLSNTSLLPKVLETPWLEQFNDHLSKMPAVQKFKPAYRRNHSVETTVTKVHNDLTI